MNKFSIKLISIVLSLIMLFTFTSSVFAQSSTVETVTIGDTTYTIHISFNGDRTVTDNKTGAVVRYKAGTGELIIKEAPGAKTVSINLNKATRKSISLAGSNSSRDNEYAYSNYLKYYNGNPYTFWEIQIPDQIKFTYEKNNATNLYNFQQNVDTLRSTQDSIYWSWGGTALAIILGIIAVTPIGLLASAILAVAGVLVGGGSITDLIE